MKINPQEAIDTFRDYTKTVYGTRQINPDIMAISTGYPIENALTMSNDMLKKLSPIQNGREINRLGYGWNFDGVALKSVISNYENAKNYTKYNVDNIGLTMGGTHGLNLVAHYIRQRNKSKFSIVTMAPTFFRLLGEVMEYAEIIPIFGKSEENFIPHINKVANSIKKSTRAIFLCNPTNPFYKYYPKNFIKKLVKEVEKRNIYLIIDEVGDAFRYGEAKEYKYPKNIISKNVIRICSSSKLFLMAEYRLGYVIGEKSVISEISRGLGNNISHINYSAVEGWKLGLSQETERLNHPSTISIYIENYNKNQKNLEECREMTITKLSNAKHIKKIIPPDACFSLIFQVESNKFRKDTEFYKALLSDKGVSVVPGSGFGIPSEDLWFRLTFAYPKEKLNKALEKIIDFIATNER